MQGGSAPGQQAQRESSRHGTAILRVDGAVDRADNPLLDAVSELQYEVADDAAICPKLRPHSRHVVLVRLAGAGEEEDDDRHQQGGQEARHDGQREEARAWRERREAQAASTGTRDQIADRANQLVPPKAVVTSNNARDQVYNAANTLSKAETNSNPSLNRIQEQVFSLSKAINEAGGSLSPDEQKAYDSIASLTGQSMGATAGARSALDSKKYKDAVGGANQYTSLESQRADIVSQLYQSLSQRSSDIQTLTKLFAPSDDEADTMKAINSTKRELRQ